MHVYLLRVRYMISYNLPGSPEDSEPNPLLLKFTTPAPHQITCHITKTNPFKASREDGIVVIITKQPKQSS